MTIQDDAPIEEVALAIAGDLDPGVDVGAQLARIDALASPLGAHATLEALAQHATGTLELRLAEDYDDPRATLLPDVIATREGTPVALAILLVAIARRAGLVLEPIAFPGHFLLRARDADVFVDPADPSRPLPRAALVDLAMREAGDTKNEAEQRLEPVGPRATAVRVLVNLQRAYRMRVDHARALVVCDRLFDATGAVLHRCDRGAHALALGAARAATAEFEAYLAARPAAPDADLVRAVLDRARAFAERPAN